MAGIFLISCQKQDNSQLDTYFWEDLIPENVFKGFVSENVEINNRSYVSNEELYSNVRFINDGSCDIIMPSNYMVTQMHKKNIISPIDISRLKNIDNIINSYLAQPYETASQYSIPYIADSIGIMINTKCVDEKNITKWDDLWNNSYTGKIAVHYEMRDMFSIALKSIGYSANTMVEEEIKEAYNKLIELFPKIEFKPYIDITSSLLNKTNCIGILYNSDAYRIIKNNPDFKFISPKEGSVLWIDSFAVPKTSDNVKSAYKFIDYMIEPYTAAQVAEYSGAIPLINYNIIKPYLSKGMQQQYESFFSDENMQRMELQQDLGPAMQTYIKYWNMLTKKE